MTLKNGDGNDTSQKIRRWEYLKRETNDADGH